MLDAWNVGRNGRQREGRHPVLALMYRSRNHHVRAWTEDAGVGWELCKKVPDSCSHSCAVRAEANVGFCEMFSEALQLSRTLGSSQ